MLDKFVFPETKFVQRHSHVGVTLASKEQALCKETAEDRRLQLAGLTDLGVLRLLQATS